jgi:hypothetical protein
MPGGSSKFLSISEISYLLLKINWTDEGIGEAPKTLTPEIIGYSHIPTWGEKMPDERLTTA